MPELQAPCYRRIAEAVHCFRQSIPSPSCFAQVEQRGTTDLRWSRSPFEGCSASSLILPVLPASSTGARAERPCNPLTPPPIRTGVFLSRSEQPRKETANVIELNTGAGKTECAADHDSATRSHISVMGTRPRPRRMRRSRYRPSRRSPSLLRGPAHRLHHLQ
jgi:hypothetical protein